LTIQDRFAHARDHRAVEIDTEKPDFHFLCLPCRSSEREQE
jgi:hypothetical protein